MLTPMTSSELHKHRAMGLYKTQADMEKDFERLRGRPLYVPTIKAGPPPTPLPVLGPDILPPVEFEIQAHDD